MVALLGMPALMAPTVWSRLASSALRGGEHSVSILVGFLIGGVGYVAIRRFPVITFLDCLQHELSHLGVALALGCSPSELSIRGDGGNVGYTMAGYLGRTRAFLISIAPYWLSPMLILPLGLTFIPSASVFMPAFISAIFGASLAAAVVQIDRRQPDLRKHGVVLPIIAALWLWTGLGAIECSIMMSGTVRVVPTMYRQSWNAIGRVFSRPTGTRARNSGSPRYR
jgi:hypothetical protein